MDLPAGLKTHAEAVNARLADLLPLESTSPEPLHMAMRYACLAGGKRLRPALCMSSALVVGGRPEQVIDAACGLEALHCFSLIHDDLPALDNDDLRRGMPTVHVKFGEAIAILAGDGLFALAFDWVSAAGDARAVRELAQASQSLVRGETLDILSEGGAADPETLERIHAWKTGALFSASCAVGGWLGGGTDHEVEALREFGARLGLSFQIADDILNETATPEQLGKAAGSDRNRGKLTYPMVYGLDSARERAQAEAARALECLQRLPGPSDELAALARYGVERQS